MYIASVQTACIGIPTTLYRLHNDRLQLSNIILLTRFSLLRYLISPGTTNRLSSLASSSVLPKDSRLACAPDPPPQL